MRVNLEQAEQDFERLIAQVEAGEEIEIARDGVPVARLVRAESASPSTALLASWGSLRGQLVIEDFEFTEAEIDEMLDGPIFPQS